ncbi:MAG: hypothetical protein WBO12_16130, partial [Xanthobacteraceae bacterium]
KSSSAKVPSSICQQRCSKLNTVQPGALKIFVDMHQRRRKGTVGKESVTVFAEFVGNSTTMAQQQNGDKPRRPFHRC